MSAQSATPEPIDPDSSGTARESVEHPHLIPVPNTPDAGPDQRKPAPAPTAPSGDHEDQEPGETSAGSWRGRYTAALEQARDLAQPPDLWDQDRPALKRVYHYARYTEQLPPSGVARYAAIGHSGLVIVEHAVAYGVAWIGERPARRAVFAVLLTLAALFPPTRALLTVLLTPPHFLIELLTNH